MPMINLYAFTLSARNIQRSYLHTLSNTICFYYTLHDLFIISRMISLLYLAWSLYYTLHDLFTIPCIDLFTIPCIDLFTIPCMISLLYLALISLLYLAWSLYYTLHWSLYYTSHELLPTLTSVTNTVNIPFYHLQWNTLATLCVIQTFSSSTFVSSSSSSSSALISSSTLCLLVGGYNIQYEKNNSSPQNCAIWPLHPL